MTLKEQIMKLQTYKMFENEDTVYVERDDVLKALEQEPVLDKIRKEIANTEISGHIRDVECFNAGITFVLNVIDKYRVESEE